MQESADIYSFLFVQLGLNTVAAPKEQYDEVDLIARDIPAADLSRRSPAIADCKAIDGKAIIQKMRLLRA